MAGTRVKFDAEKFEKELLAKKREWDREQTRRLVNYAAQEIIKIGNNMRMEDTGNLLDSLCWGVWFNGSLAKYGFYRQQEAEYDSYLHEISPEPPRQSVNGRNLAQIFLSEYQPVQRKGWEVVWAATAPYYAYWEQGHENVFLGGQFVQFSTMAERYDKIKGKLEPKARVQFLIEVPVY